MLVLQADLMSSEMTIGAVARLTGKRASAIRYYEEIGLLPQPARVGGRRLYHEGILRSIAVIDTGQRAGLTLDEIKVLLHSVREGSASERLRQIAERKLPEITALIERSELVRGWLECAAQCECPSLEDCPLFDDSPTR
jgi:MerR family transcriptional regulator, redox-sensitive transcriptional activator SoxR